MCRSSIRATIQLVACPGEGRAPLLSDQTEAQRVGTIFLSPGGGGGAGGGGAPPYCTPLLLDQTEAQRVGKIFLRPKPPPPPPYVKVCIRH